MKFTTMLLSSIFGMCAMAQKDPSPPLACNLNAISTAERPRYGELMKQLRAAVRQRQELSDGYTYRLDGKSVSLLEVAEWIKSERLCCPFLNLQLEVSGQVSDWRLHLRGPAGVKTILDQEFPQQRK
jgi:hypothetical protein